MDTEKQRAFIIRFLYFSILMLLFYVFFQYIIPYLLPFILGFFIAFMLRPIIRIFVRITKGHEKFWSIVIILFFYALLGVILSYCGMKIYFWTQDVLVKIPEWYQNTMEPFLQDSFSHVQVVWKDYDGAISSAITSIWEGLQNFLSGFVTDLSQNILSILSNLLSSVPKFLLTFFIAIFSSFFFTSDYHNLSNFFFQHFSTEKQKIILSIRYFATHTFLNMFIATIKLMLLTFFELVIGLSILDIKKAWLIALGITIFDVLPILGTGGIMIPWILFSYVQGQHKLAIGLLILYLIITLIRNIVEPKLMGKQLGLHPLLMLLCMYAGGKLFGVFGFMCMPMVLLILKNLNEEEIIHLYKCYNLHESKCNISTHVPHKMRHFDK